MTTTDFDMTPGARRIARERARQLSVEGWTPEHDLEEHGMGELLRAALGYAAVGFIRSGEMPPSTPPANWPWDDDWWKPSHDPLRNLEKAGALIAAEIDRILGLREVSE